MAAKGEGLVSPAICCGQDKVAISNPTAPTGTKLWDILPFIL